MQQRILYCTDIDNANTQARTYALSTGEYSQRAMAQGGGCANGWRAYHGVREYKGRARPVVRDSRSFPSRPYFNRLVGPSLPFISQAKERPLPTTGASQPGSSAAPCC